MEQEKEFYIKKICAALEGATLAEVLTIYAAVAAYIRPHPSGNDSRHQQRINEG